MMGIREAQDSADTVALGLVEAAEATPAAPVWVTGSIFAGGSSEGATRDPS
jgi:hypothetical protein